MDMTAFLDNWRLPKKLFLAFSILAVLLCIVGLNTYKSTNRLNEVAQMHLDRGVAGMSGLMDVISQAKEQRIAVYGLLKAATPEAQARQAAVLKEGSATLLKSVEDYAAVAGDDFQSEVNILREKVAELDRVMEQISARAAAGERDVALAMVDREGRVSSDAVMAQTEKLIEMSRNRSDIAAKSGEDTAKLSIIISIALSIANLIGIIVIWAFINRSVAQPMADLANVTTTLAQGGKASIPHTNRQDEIGHIAVAVEQFRNISEQRLAEDARAAAELELVTNSLRDNLAALTEGDLSQAITIEYPPAYAVLKTNFNAAIASLRELIGAVTQSAGAIRTGSSEIAQASEDLARRTESNAASLEETSAAITQMDERLRATATAATHTVERANTTMSVITSGRDVAEEAVQAMGRVSESAKGIDSVIEGLDKIAFQTRVLAMNAAVEAGRAGDAGRGFAVVADLVSALAMRSEEEAKRAREQLTATQTDIVTAVEAVQKVDGALENIAQNGAAVNDLLNGIAADNQAQSSTITQINAAIGTMDQTTQQNAAMVEETSAAARNLSSEVTALADRAAMFNVGNVAPSNRSAPAPRSAPVSFSPASTGQSRSMNAVPPADDWLDF